jgi:hypothetical protein
MPALPPILNVEDPAETMRRAAMLMRERAGAASPGPWHQMCMGSDGCQVLNDGRLRERKHVSFSGRKEWKADHADAEHIASWNPLVALAVADWLDNEAVNAPGPGDVYLRGGRIAYALTVACAYLGEGR